MATLTPREHEVLALIGRRLRSRQIAHTLRIGETTVRKHRANLCGKLGLGSAAQLVAHAVNLQAPAPAPHPDLGRLAPREREVLAEVAAGLTSKQIARRLRISPRTVEKHRQNLMRKLDMHDMAGLMHAARRLAP